MPGPAGAAPAGQAGNPAPACYRPGPGASPSRSRITTARRRRKPSPSRTRPAPVPPGSAPSASVASAATRPGIPSGSSTFRCGTPSTCRTAYARSLHPYSGCVTAVTTTSHGSRARKRRSLSPSWSRPTSRCCTPRSGPCPGGRYPAGAPRETGHGRAETRTIKAAHVAGLDFPQPARPSRSPAGGRTPAPAGPPARPSTPSPA